METFEFEITNWDEYQERADRPNYTWFKLHSEICDSAFWHKTGHAEKILFLFLLAQRNKSRRKTFFVKDIQLEAYCQIGKKDLLTHIDKLVSLGVIQEHSRQIPAQPREDSRQNVGSRLEEKRIEKNNAHSASAPVSLDFESLYKKYPLKKGKTRGMKLCQREIKSEADFQLLSQAIDNYSREIKAEKTAPRFIKHFSSFMNCWRDALESSKPTAAPHPFTEMLMGKNK